MKPKYDISSIQGYLLVYAKISLPIIFVKLKDINL